MAEPIIEAHDLGISFTKTRRRKLSLRDLFLHRTARTSPGLFWPLRHVSFKIRGGEAVGIIGRNGTGKSTLLKLIAGVLIPDEGRVKVRGEVAPLLELRAGFNEELSGRENIYLLASLHGMKQSEIDAAFDEIVDFAEVREFIDMRLRHYSSGMKVRLGFAVIAQLDHPILLVDEVLAVGDRVFKQKCYKVIQELLDQGRTLLLVSHSEKDLQRFCKRGVFISAGELIVDGTLDEALDAYHDTSGFTGGTNEKKPKQGKGRGAKRKGGDGEPGDHKPGDEKPGAAQHGGSPADVAAGNK